ncbi:MAG: hypothetical protein KF892_24000 [Rhizobacter sp.]|nr:hypothetical protein [Rhizobacter sp.]
MADTSVNHEAERWIVEHGLPVHFEGQRFQPKRLKLTWGGLFAFDAVSDDGKIVAAVSTSAARTATKKLASAKYQKLKTDALYLLHVDGDCRKVMVFTESCMHDYFKATVLAGRFPPAIELVHIPLPPPLQARVLVTRSLASKETSPARQQDAV